MRTAINASWLVGHDSGGHTLIRDGVVVYEDNRVISVGTSFDGPVDRTIDATNKLVAPGFIDTHVHSGHRASHRLITDAGRPLFYGQPFLEIRSRRRARRSPATRAGSITASPRPKRGSSSTPPTPSRSSFATASPPLPSWAPRLRCRTRSLKQVKRFGSRAYLAPGYDSGRWVGDELGRLERIHDEQRGIDGLKIAMDWIERNDGALGGRIRGLLVPRRSRPRPWTCSNGPRDCRPDRAADRHACRVQHHRVPRGGSAITR